MLLEAQCMKLCKGGVQLVWPQLGRIGLELLGGRDGGRLAGQPPQIGAW